jgi:NADH-quinone oxidoreductase subunit L
MVTAEPLLRWIVLVPALGFLWNATLGQRAPRSAAIVGPGVVGVAFVLALVAVLRLHGIEAGHEGGPPMLHDFVYRWISVPWISGEPFHADVAFRLDAISAIMVLVVTGIGFLIHVYSVGYMHGDPCVARFFTYLNLFITAMLVLVLADNLVLLFVGWEGVGLCSYLLIGFWYETEANVVAGKKAFIANRIGDASFLLGLFLLVQYTGTLDVAELQLKAPTLNAITLGGWALPTVVCLLLFGGATGKSAQIPLYVWLPDAMAGPTPVSALIHAATMVTAGVYMVTRLHFLFGLETAAPALTVIAWIGALTALLAATIAIAQADIKKVLAYSTVSQLGYMFLGLGVGVTGAALFHVVTHAFFKGLLFLGAGSVIHGMHGEQDMQKMGGLRRHMPGTYWTMLVATLAIAGVPPLSGFFSKDEIITGAFLGPHPQPILGVVAYAVAFLTAVYMGRMLFLTFFGKERFDHHHVHPHESPWSMLGPLVVLAVLSAVGGMIDIPGQVHHFIGGSAEEPHATPVMLAAAIAMAAAGLALAWYCYVREPSIPEQAAAASPRLYALLRDKWRVDELYEATVVRFVFALAAFGARFFDPAILDGIVDGTASLFRALSDRWRRLQTGNLQHVALSFVVGALLLLGYWVGR